MNKRAPTIQKVCQRDKSVYSNVHMAFVCVSVYCNCYTHLCVNRINGAFSGCLCYISRMLVIVSLSLSLSHMNTTIQVATKAIVTFFSLLLLLYYCCLSISEIPCKWEYFSSIFSLKWDRFAIKSTRTRITVPVVRQPSGIFVIALCVIYCVI